MRLQALAEWVPLLRDHVIIHYLTIDNNFEEVLSGIFFDVQRRKSVKFSVVEKRLLAIVRISIMSIKP